MLLKLKGILFHYAEIDRNAPQKQMNALNVLSNRFLPNGLELTWNWRSD